MSFIPARRNFTGFNPAKTPNDGIRQGSDWTRDTIFVDATGALIDMTAFQPGFGGTVRASFKSADRVTTYFSTAAATCVLTWIDSNTLRIKIPSTASANLVVAADPKFPNRLIPNTAIYAVEGVSGVTGLTERLLEGRFEVDRETVTTST